MTSFDTALLATVTGAANDCMVTNRFDTNLSIYSDGKPGQMSSIAPGQTASLPSGWFAAMPFDAPGWTSNGVCRGDGRQFELGKSKVAGQTYWSDMGPM